MTDFQVDVEEIPPKSLMVNMYEALYSQLIYKFQPFFLEMNTEPLFRCQVIILFKLKSIICRA